MATSQMKSRHLEPVYFLPTY